MGEFALREREVAPDMREVQVSGELDLAVAGRLAERLEQLGRESVAILLSLEHCEFIDSTGISVIVHAHQEASRNGGGVAVYGASHQVARVLALTGLDENGLVFESAARARAAFRVGS